MELLLPTEDSRKATPQTYLNASAELQSSRKNNKIERKLHINDNSDECSGDKISRIPKKAMSPPGAALKTHCSRIPKK